MSWSFTIIGKKADVVAAVEKQSSFPDSLKAVVRDFVGTQEIDSQYYNGFEVSSHGHYDPVTGGNIGKFEINLIQVAPPAPVPATLNPSYPSSPSTTSTASASAAESTATTQSESSDQAAS